VTTGSIVCLPTGPAIPYAECVSTRKRTGESARAKTVAGAIWRTGKFKPQGSGRNLKGGIKPPTDLVETTQQARRNAERADLVLTVGPLKGATALGALKARKAGAAGKVVKASRNQRSASTLTDRVFRPMTRRQATAISAAMHDPNLPTRKLSPRR
jgi:hypothetical protein